MPIAMGTRFRPNLQIVLCTRHANIGASFMNFFLKYAIYRWSLRPFYNSKWRPDTLSAAMGTWLDTNRHDKQISLFMLLAECVQSRFNLHLAPFDVNVHYCDNVFMCTA